MNKDLKRKILQLFYPSRCPLCNEIIHYSDRFCSDCRGKLIKYEGDFRVRNAASFTAAFIYDENVLPAISLLKNGVCDNADFALGGELADVLKNSDIPAKIDIIIPVPIHIAKKTERTYNQAELLAKIIGETLELPVCTNAIIKNRATADQKKLGRISRMVNLKSAFTALHPELIRGKRILLVDDICTTGSTLAEIAALLLENGAETVHCAACCKTPLKATGTATVSRT